MRIAGFLALHREKIGTKLYGYVLANLSDRIPTSGSMIDSLPESLMSLRCGLRTSEENSQAEFHLSRSIRLAGDHTETGRTIDI